VLEFIEAKTVDAPPAVFAPLEAPINDNCSLVSDPILDIIAEAIPLAFDLWLEYTPDVNSLAIDSKLPTTTE
jgi:hypothetical protein